MSNAKGNHYGFTETLKELLSYGGFDLDLWLLNNLDKVLESIGTGRQQLIDTANIELKKLEVLSERSSVMNEYLISSMRTLKHGIRKIETIAEPKKDDLSLE